MGEECDWVGAIAAWRGATDPTGVIRVGAAAAATAGARDDTHWGELRPQFGPYFFFAH